MSDRLAVVLWWFIELTADPDFSCGRTDGRTKVFQEVLADLKIHIYAKWICYAQIQNDGRIYTEVFTGRGLPYLEDAHMCQSIFTFVQLFPDAFNLFPYLSAPQSVALRRGAYRDFHPSIHPSIGVADTFWLLIFTLNRAKKWFNSIFNLKLNRKYLFNKY